METTAERRKRKLADLAQRFAAQGGLTHLAIQADVNPAYLDQISKGVLLKPKKDGTRSPRQVGDELARKLEDAFKLGTGWFDAPDGPATLAPDALALAQAFDALPSDSPQALAMRQQIYWAIHGLIAGAAGRLSSIPAPAPAAQPTAQQRRRQ